MKAILAVLTVAGLLAGCRSADPGGGPDGPPPPVRGLTIAPYSGVFAAHPRLVRALADLPDALGRAERDVAARLGLTLDPDRPRRVFLTDDPEAMEVTSRVVGGRRVQEVPVAAGALAQGRIDTTAAALDAIARAAIADHAGEGLPDWFARGAPAWISGEWERGLHERLLGQARIPRVPGDRIPPLRLERGGNDEVTSALFLRFLAVEFGAGHVADLGRALVAGGGVAASLRAALGTDPASVPTAFEGFRLRVAGEILDDPYVRELAAARGLPAGGRAGRLAGLADRAADPWVAAAILEERARAEYETGDDRAAEATLAAVEREHVRHALSLDRDRYLLALTFLGSGQPDAAALRLSAFLLEFPRSSFAEEARCRLGEILLAAGRSREAMEEFRRVAKSGRAGPPLVRAAVALGTFEMSQFRFGAARRWLGLAPDSEEAARLLAGIDRLEARGLPYEARLIVEGAVRDLWRGPADRADAAATTLADVGAAAADALIDRLEGDPAEWPGTYVARALELGSAWKSPAGDRLLTRLLAAKTAGVGPAALRDLVARGHSAEELRRACPEGSEARVAWAQRFGRGGVPEEVLGLVASEDFEERVAGAERLGMTPGSEAVDRLIALTVDESPLVRAAVAEALGHRVEPEAADPLRTLAVDPAAGVRTQALRAAAARGDWATVEAAFEGDPDAEIRAHCGALLLESGRPGSAARVVCGLGADDPRVRILTEALLRETVETAVGPALADALDQAEEPGHAMRIVRVIAARSGTDFGYDPEGGWSEKHRVAKAYRRFLATPAKDR